MAHLPCTDAELAATLAVAMVVAAVIGAVGVLLRMIGENHARSLLRSVY